jgi:DNA processing protein
LLPGAEFEAWFRLLETPGLGRDGARRLLAAFGDPAAALAASPTALRAVAGPSLVAAFALEPPEFQSRLSVARAWCEGGPHRHVVTLGDAAYPPLLLQTADPPLLLYAHGELALLAKPAIAIVGSRRPSAQGRDNARAFARELADDGLVVVSGLAQGIDSAAHEGALAGAAGTIAVVGTGLDRVYPPQNLELAHRITQHGLLLSEFAPGTPPLPEHFPLRNRVIAGLSLGTLVVEAAIRSGSLITARLASEAGRDVFAVPGSIHAPQAKGCHWLIKQGAKLVESAADIVDELAGQRADRDDRTTSADPEASADPLLDALGHDPVTLDALQARTGWPTHELTTRLLELELDGDVARLPGGLYQRRHAG